MICDFDLNKKFSDHSQQCNILVFKTRKSNILKTYFSALTFQLYVKEVKNTPCAQIPYYICFVTN